MIKQLEIIFRHGLERLITQASTDREIYSFRRSHKLFSFVFGDGFGCVWQRIQIHNSEQIPAATIDFNMAQPQVHVISKFP